jgi:hypothetical protein
VPAALWDNDSRGIAREPLDRTAHEQNADLFPGSVTSFPKGLLPRPQRPLDPRTRWTEVSNFNANIPGSALGRIPEPALGRIRQPGLDPVP